VSGDELKKKTKTGALWGDGEGGRKEKAEAKSEKPHPSQRPLRMGHPEGRKAKQEADPSSRGSSLPASGQAGWQRVGL